MLNGILFKDPAKDFIVISGQLDDEVIKLAHNQGHYGLAKTLEIVEKYDCILRLTTKVTKIVKSCVE